MLDGLKKPKYSPRWQCGVGGVILIVPLLPEVFPIPTLVIKKSSLCNLRPSGMYFLFDRVQQKIPNIASRRDGEGVGGEVVALAQNAANCTSGNYCIKTL